MLSPPHRIDSQFVNPVKIPCLSSSAPDIQTAGVCGGSTERSEVSGAGSSSRRDDDDDDNDEDDSAHCRAQSGGGGVCRLNLQNKQNMASCGQSMQRCKAEEKLSLQSI